jgi:hypothetical protein
MEPGKIPHFNYGDRVYRSGLSAGISARLTCAGYLVRSRGLQSVFLIRILLDIPGEHVNNRYEEKKL